MVIWEGRNMSITLSLASVYIKKISQNATNKNEITWSSRQNMSKDK